MAKHSRLTGGAEHKVMPKHMGTPSVPNVESSVENRKSEHKLSRLEMNTRNRDIMAGAINRVEQFTNQRKRKNPYSAS